MENTNYNNKQIDQVFINFRGKDGRFTFLSHFKQKLIDGNVNVFTDEDAPGQPLKSLFKHIRNSTIAVVIFSENYAESVWCLQELSVIMKCIKKERLKAVIPIFHMVDASDIKEQRGKFGEKFLELQNYLLAKKDITEAKIKRIDSKIKKWKKALEVVTGMIGYSYDGKSSEYAFVEKMVEKVKISLTKIAIEEGRDIFQETRKGKQQPIQLVFTINQLNIQSQLLMDSLSLGKWNPAKGYSMSIDMKPPSHELKRTNSDLDQIYGPFPVEAIIAQMMKVKNQERIDNVVLSPSEATVVQNQGSIDNNIVLQKSIGCTTCISHFSFFFGLPWMMVRRMILSKWGNGTSVASN